MTVANTIVPNQIKDEVARLKAERELKQAPGQVQISREHYEQICTRI